MLILAQLLPPEPIGHGYSIVIYKDKVIITHASRHDIFIPLYACEWYAHDQNVFVMAVTDYAQPGFLIVHQLDMPTGKMAVEAIPKPRDDLERPYMSFEKRQEMSRFECLLSG